ncbi:MAG: hypothetical protein IH626_16645 [Rhodospirillales bacterium]|nr:hypothetical protein [Rhodospirillales bacterium]
MAETGAFHENLKRGETVEVGSERSFGIVFAVVFAIIGLFPLVGDGGVRIWALAVAGGILLAALAAPRLLRPANRLWFRFGGLLHRIVTPLILGLIFFSTVTPTGWLMRLFGKDPMNLRFEPEAPSYWIRRDPPGPAPDSMKYQF